MPPPVGPLRRGDRAFERLYRRHVADVYRFALAMLRNPADAEDVTQTTFLNAYRAYRGGERPRAARSWLITIAHNVCRQRFRELRRRGDEVELDETAALAAAPEEAAPSADDIRRALSNLRFTQRAALVMRELEGRSYAEIGEVLGLSTSAVETLVFRARRALREQLEGTLTCADAERAISRQLDRRLGRPEQRLLRAHLRECPECASLARRERARRTALRGLGAIPLPHSLASFFGGGAAGGGIATKAATVVAAGALVGGASYEAVEVVRAPPAAAAEVAAVQRSAPPAAVLPVALPVSPEPAARTAPAPARAAAVPPRARPATIARAKPKAAPRAETRQAPRVRPRPEPQPAAPPPAPPPAVVAVPEPAPEPHGRTDAPGRTKGEEHKPQSARPPKADEQAAPGRGPGKGKAEEKREDRGNGRAKEKTKAKERGAEPAAAPPAAAATPPEAAASPPAPAAAPGEERVPPGQAGKDAKEERKESRAEDPRPQDAPPPAAEPPRAGPPETPPGQEKKRD
jgi:RNA polymerase sigma factor (sigma-70 family)